MPLIQVKTSSGWHADSELSLAYRLGKGLPPAFIENGRTLLLDADTPEDAVEVDFPQYHPSAINSPDIGIFVLFTEDPPSKEERRQVRDVVEEIVEDLLDEYEQFYAESLQAVGPDDPTMEPLNSRRPGYTVDCFWGPGTGCMICADREPQYW